MDHQRNGPEDSCRQDMELSDVLMKISIRARELSRKLRQIAREKDNGNKNKHR